MEGADAVVDPRHCGRARLLDRADGLSDAGVSREPAGRSRGILLNPNGTDTDGDGLADGQELFVTLTKTPKRYPIPDFAWTNSDPIALSLGAPGWALASAILMTGFTHPDMGQLQARVWHQDAAVGDRIVTLRSYANPGEANNFTSYDLLNAGYARPEFLGGAWRAQAYDCAGGTTGQIEYAQIQVTVHTRPDRADSDADGLNDSEEMNLGSDGFATNPWTADTDGDGLADTEYSAKGTDPTQADTDRDGYADGVDRYPLDDVFLKISLVSASLPSTRRETDSTAEEGAAHDAYLEPFAVVRSGSEALYSVWPDGPYDTLYWPSHVAEFYVNVPDDAPTVSLTVELWDYDFDVSNPDPIDLSTASGMQNSVTFTYALQPLRQSTNAYFSGSANGHTGLYATQFWMNVATVAPERADIRLLSPLDYAVFYNVTDSAGNLVSRRYVGEPRFVAFTLRPSVGRTAYPILYLVPRSLFFATAFHDLLRREALPADLAAALTFAQNGTSSSNSDILQMTFSGALGTDLLGTLDTLLLTNVSGVVVNRLEPVASYVDVLGLPDDAARLAGWTPFPHTVTLNYTWNLDTTPLGLCETPAPRRQGFGCRFPHAWTAPE